MNTCKHCKWWRRPIENEQQEDLGLCMYDPPAVFCDYDSSMGEAALIYERPKTYEYDFCSRLENTERK